jgi:hypothetical protein
MCVFLNNLCLKQKVYVLRGLHERKSELQVCYVVVSAVSVLKGHQSCVSHLHILFRLLILQDHTATLDTG